MKTVVSVVVLIASASGAVAVNTAVLSAVAVRKVAENYVAIQAGAGHGNGVCVVDVGCCCICRYMLVRSMLLMCLPAL